MTYEEARQKAECAAEEGREIPCPVCGKLFLPFHTYSPYRHTGVFCSMECAKESLQSMPKASAKLKACAVCGNLFRTHNKVCTCSKECAAEFIRQQKASRKAAGLNPEGKVCPVCGKQFYVRERPRQVFCCRSCAAKSRFLGGEKCRKEKQISL